MTINETVNVGLANKIPKYVSWKGRVYNVLKVGLHHWLNFSLVLGFSIFFGGGILSSWITRGALIGVIFQGITTKSPTARKVIYK